MLLAAVLYVDHSTDWLKPFKAKVMQWAEPLYIASELPNHLTRWIQGSTSSDDELKVANAQLEAENLVLKGKVQRLVSLAIENVRLRELLNSTSLLEEKVLVGEIISVSAIPQSHHVVLNKGMEDGVFEGQAVIDAKGLFGQVVNVSDTSSQVLLVSDIRHAVPVQVNRNGVRAIAEGTGDFYRLTVPNIAPTTDIEEGDILSTSGLGGIFPVGYPVAQVTSVEHEKGQSYLTIEARPFALLDRSRHVLLLFSREYQNEG
ncbi:Cell shape-determining protein MreC [BD1-7 clade bacterium]|uniref:Cell shape-determining protein MreC n=1 Tax=BD1-7 clade bacterium TaxID=2029982 RepID=A0A5S9N4T8_9GAMM|nr:Cell shape-determining protein MreC [BD1-7 clade bacterium]CAA0084768.1 Cell shape-determining protein MreC [BD1-7 clade bacterium]